MKLVKAHVKNYRSVRDSEVFEIEPAKTILVGSNEAGKTVLLRALQQINPPPEVPKFDPLRDYPRSDYNDITTKKVDPAKTDVVVAYFTLDDDDKANVPGDFQHCVYVTGRRLNNSNWDRLEGGPAIATYGQIKNDLTRLATHLNKNIPHPAEGTAAPINPTQELSSLTSTWADDTAISDQVATGLDAWLTKSVPHVDENNATEEARLKRLQDACTVPKRRATVIETLRKRLPIFVLFNNYFRVRPIIHLDHLATRLEQHLLDDDQYDYGNECLLKLLGFTARELSNLGKATEPPAADQTAFKAYRDQLDKRAYQLNAASVRLTDEIRSIWNPNPQRAEPDRLRITADGQYLKVVVEI